MSRSPATKAALDALQTTAGNIRSLGPAGALSEPYTPYRPWLALVERAIAALEAEGVTK